MPDLTVGHGAFTPYDRLSLEQIKEVAQDMRHFKKSYSTGQGTKPPHNNLDIIHCGRVTRIFLNGQELNLLSYYKLERKSDNTPDPEMPELTVTIQIDGYLNCPEIAD